MHIERDATERCLMHVDSASGLSIPASVSDGFGIFFCQPARLVQMAYAQRGSKTRGTGRDAVGQTRAHGVYDTYMCMYMMMVGGAAVGVVLCSRAREVLHVGLLWAERVGPGLQADGMDAYSLQCSQRFCFYCLRGEPGGCPSSVQTVLRKMRNAG